MKDYRLMKAGEGRYTIRDKATDAKVGALSGSDSAWTLVLFGADFRLKSKAKALGVVRGVFAARKMVADVFTHETA